MEKQSSILSPLAYSLFILLFAFLFYSSSALANTFVFNPNTLTWKAIDSNGKVVRTGRGSGGRRYCPDIHRGCKTPIGVFTIWSKGGAGCKSSRYPVGKGAHLCLIVCFLLSIMRYMVLMRYQIIMRVMVAYVCILAMLTGLVSIL